MRATLRSAFAAAVVVAASLTAACSSSPLEPTAKPQPVKAQPSQAPVSSGYAITWS